MSNRSGVGPAASKKRSSRNRGRKHKVKRQCRRTDGRADAGETRAKETSARDKPQDGRVWNNIFGDCQRKTVRTDNNRNQVTGFRKHLHPLSLAEFYPSYVRHCSQFSLRGSGWGANLIFCLPI